MYFKYDKLSSIFEGADFRMAEAQCATSKSLDEQLFVMHASATTLFFLFLIVYYRGNMDIMRGKNVLQASINSGYAA